MKKKKTLKGMTLVEIIIALAIFAMLGMILVQVGTLIDNTNKATARLNRKVNAQSPYAASQNIEYTDYDADGNPVPSELTPEVMNISVSIDDIGGNPQAVNVKVKKNDGSEEYETKTVMAEINLSAKRYNTKAIVEDNPNIYDPDGPNRNHNLKFAVIDKEVALTTLTMEVNGTATITDAYGYTLSGANNWIVENEVPVSPYTDVASVDSEGNVIAYGEGTCVVTCEKDGLYFTTEVIVVPAGT